MSKLQVVLVTSLHKHQHILYFTLKHQKTSRNHKLLFWEIGVSPTYFGMVIISSVIWPNTIFLLATFAVSPKYFVTFLKSPKHCCQCFIKLFATLYYFCHQFLWSISISPKSLCKSSKRVWSKTTKSPFFAFFTKSGWTRGHSSNL